MYSRIYTVIIRTVLTCTLIICLFSASNLRADTNLSVTLDPTQGTADDTFELAVTLSGDTANGSAVPNIEESADFSITSSGRSSRVSIINGHVSQEFTYSFVVTPRPDLPPGKYQLPQISIPLDSGVEKKSGPTLEIAKPSVLPNQQQPRNGINFSQEVSTLTPYVGQQIHYQLSLQTPGEIIPEKVTDLSAAGMWKETLNEDRSQIHGASARTARLVDEEVALFPTQSGEQQIDARTLLAQVPRIAKRPKNPFPFGGFGTDDLFGDFFGGSPFMDLEQRRFNAPAITLKVQPLPPPPESHLGYIPVGRVSLASSIDSDTLETGETATLKIELYGDANLRPLTISVPTDKAGSFNIYPGQPNVERIVQGDRIFFKKTFSWALVPTKPGKLAIPSIKIVYFDPAAAEYKMLYTPERTLTVSGDPISGAAPASRDTVVPAPAGASKAPVGANSASLPQVHTASQPLTFLPTNRTLPQILVIVVCLVGALLFLAKNRKRNFAEITPDKFVALLQKKRHQLSLDQMLEEIRNLGELLAEEDTASHLSIYSRVPEQFVENLARSTSDDSLLQRAKSLRIRIEAARYAPENVNQNDCTLAADLVDYLADGTRHLRSKGIDTGRSA